MKAPRPWKLLAIPLAFALPSMGACGPDSGTGSGPAAPIVQAFQALAAELRIVQVNRQWTGQAFGFPVGSTSSALANAGNSMGVTSSNPALVPSNVAVVDWISPTGSVVPQAGISFDFASLTPGTERFQYSGGTTPFTTDVVFVGTSPRSSEFRFFEYTGSATPDPSRTTCGGTFNPFTLMMYGSESSSGSVHMTFENGDYMVGTSRSQFWDFASPEEVEVDPGLFAFERWSLLGRYGLPADPLDNVTMEFEGDMSVIFRFANQGNQTCLVFYNLMIVGTALPNLRPNG